MTSRFLSMAASLAFPAGCAAVTPPAEEKPGGREQRLTELRTVKAQHPADLDRVRVGDLVDITFSEVRALSVRKRPDHE